MPMKLCLPGQTYENVEKDTSDRGFAVHYSNAAVNAPITSNTMKDGYEIELLNMKAVLENLGKQLSTLTSTVDNHSSEIYGVKTSLNAEAGKIRDRQIPTQYTKTPKKKKCCYVVLAVIVSFIVGGSLATGIILSCLSTDKSSREKTNMDDSPVSFKELIEEQSNKTYQLIFAESNKLETINITYKTIFDSLSKTITSIGKNVDKYGESLAAGSYTASDNTLFWTKSGNGSQKMNFDEATSACNTSGATIAQIRKVREYNAIMRILRSQIYANGNDYPTTTWIDLDVNPLTGEPIPKRAFTKWQVDEPQTGELYKNFTKTALSVSPDPSDPEQGMKNFDPDQRLHKVVCQK
ncbi:uncharacterized protein LOC120335325 isoform X2 [Styela clava]